MPRKPGKREPPVPEERVDTIRRHLVSLLEEYRLAGRELSKITGLPERELYDHLEHVRRTLHKEGRTLVVEPAVCERCGFQFRKRERLSKPGKCPLCHGSLIASPLFSIPLPVESPRVHSPRLAASVVPAEAGLQEATPDSPVSGTGQACQTRNNDLEN